MDTSPGPYLGFPWQLVGGDLAIDLVNTVAWRRDPDRVADRLVDPAHLADWLAVAGLRYGWNVAVTPAALRGSGGQRALARVRDLREATADLLAAQLTGQPLPDGPLQGVRAEIDRARSRASVAARLPLRYELDCRSAEDVGVLLGLAVDRLCSRDDLARLRCCADDGCGWYFLDVSRNRSRRWCDPADCGNRARVRAFSARSRRSAAAPPP